MEDSQNIRLPGLLPILSERPSYQDVLRSIQGRQSYRAPLSVPQAARPYTVAALAADLPHPLILVTARSDRAQQLADQLRVWMDDPERVFHFADPDALPYERIPWARVTVQERLHALVALTRSSTPSKVMSPTASEPAGPGPPVIVASARAVMQKTLTPRELRLALRPLRRGQIVSLHTLLERWVGFGYQPATLVEEPGSFSQRGGIVDIYPPNLAWPVRLEMFGDEVDSLRTFDPSTQRTREHIDEVLIGPASEALAKRGPQAADLLQQLDISGCQTLTRQRLEQELDKLSQGTGFRGIEYYLPYMFSQPAMLLDYLPAGGLLVVEDGAELLSTWTSLEAQAEGLQQDLVRARELPSGILAPHFGWQEFFDRLPPPSNGPGPLILGRGGLDGVLAAEPSPLAQAFAPGTRYGGRLRQLLDDAQLLLHAEGQRLVLVTRQAPRLASLFSEAGNPTHLTAALSQPPSAGQATVLQGTLAEGWELSPSPTLSLEETETTTSPYQAGLSLLTDTELFGWAAPHRRRRPRPRAMAPETFFAEVTPGDFVVHIEHGIGRFQGLTAMDVAGTEREYLQVDYAQGDRLYVPVHQADRLSRYVAAQDVPPVLHRLGTADWGLVKRRAQRAVAELAKELLELYATREVVHGHAFGPDTPWQAELEASFPYIETEDQLLAVEEVKEDMERPRPMDRLVCGDVGYGKTEVALRAAFKAVMDGKQVALLVPTTVLAQQHLDTFTQRLRPYPVEVRMLSRFRSRRQQQETVERLVKGSVDIVVGTHRLLSEDVSFKDLGLLIVDEEQRFGVSHKEKIKQLRQEVDVLTLTATPIPRTLYMSLSGVRDMSTINTPPEERLPIRTIVAEYDETLIRQAILREMDRGGQVYFVFNRVRGIVQMTERLRRLVPEATFAMGHGQMRESELAQVMSDFAAGNMMVLVCTTIIQSGLDIPNANTIIIHRADRFGLADLYQLRGRVGRGGVRAYAYLLHDKYQTLSPVARSRLESILEASQLGAGFHIAMRDLEIRGAGELLGVRQHGHIAAVGFDLYTRLLAQAVQEVRSDLGDGRETALIDVSERLQEPIAPPVALEVPLIAHIPDHYVPETTLRLQLYRRLSGMSGMDELDRVKEELEDRFGPLPDAVINLLYVVRLKLLCLQAGVSSISLEDHQLVLQFDTMTDLPRDRVQSRLRSAVVVGAHHIRLPMDDETNWQPELVRVLEVLPELIEKRAE